MYELSIKGDIASAHFLPGYEGKCQQLHGHTWKIEVVIGAGQLNRLGMVADFAVLKKKLREFLKQIDHVCLNDHPFFKNINPTTENIAKCIHDHFSRQIEPLNIQRVQVWESETSSVVYYE